MNMIFAGDFAQLPPVGGSHLFSPDSKVPAVHSNGQKLAEQKASVGKILWRQVDTVVILKQNMRQTEMTTDDLKLRVALENMRYGACTAEDLKYPRSRTISRRAGHPTFNDPGFRCVSVITALNSHKDKINELGCKNFAEETV
jgi:hypothetical protein